MIRGALSVSKYIWTQTQSYCARELIIIFLDAGWHETKRKQCPQLPTQILKRKPECVKHKCVNVVLTLCKTYIWIHLLHLFLSVTCCEQNLSPVWDISCSKQVWMKTLFFGLHRIAFVAFIAQTKIEAFRILQILLFAEDLHTEAFVYLLFA